MKISRRALAGMALAGAASSQTTVPVPQPAAGSLDQAKRLVARNSESLRKHEIPMATEPAFQFKA